MKKKLIKNKYIPWVVLSIVFIFTVLLNYYVQWRCLDSDMASEMVLANLLNKEGAIISKNWNYSTEVRVFCEQIWFQLGLLLSPNNWRIARLIGHSINLAILIGSFIFLLYSTSIKEKGIWIAIVLLLPFDFWYLFFVTFGGFYICHTVALFVMLGLLLRYINNNNKVYLILLFIFGFVFGLNGIKVLMYYTIPCFLTLVIIGVYRYISNKTIDTFKPLVIGTIISLISTFLGVFVYIFIICKEYTCYPTFYLKWGNIDIKNILRVVGNYLQSLGFINSDRFVTNIKILSLDGIFGVFGLINIIAFIIGLAILLKNKFYKLCKDKLLFFFIISAYLTGICIFSLTQKEVDASYWLPFIPFSILIIELAIESVKESGLNTKYIRTVLLLSFMCCSFVNTKWYLNNSPRSYKGLQNVTQFLQDRGCKKVIAEFWSGNAITEYSNGEIEVFVINDYGSSSIYDFLQIKDHKESPFQKDIYVVIPSNYEYTRDLSFYEKNATIVMNDNDFIVYQIK